MTTFNCPIFDVETSTAACGKLMELKYVGKHVEVRKGCQACMASSKCPLVNATMMNANRRKTGNEIRLAGKLPKELLERIRPIVVMDRDLNRYGVSEVERSRILSANDRIDKLLGSAPSADSQPKRRSAPKTTKPAAPAMTHTDKAAATGDLAAAISQAA